MGAAMAAASPYQLSGHIRHRAAPERRTATAASRVRLKRIIKKIYIPLPGRAPSSCSALASFSSLCLAPSPLLTASLFSLFLLCLLHLHLRQICLSVILSVCLSDSRFFFGSEFFWNYICHQRPSLPPSLLPSLPPSPRVSYHHIFMSFTMCAS